MNRNEFINRVIEAGTKFNVVDVRVHKDRNYGLEVQTYSLWLVGSYSSDVSLCMGMDSYPLCVRFRSLEKANKERDKFKRWLDSTFC